MKYPPRGKNNDIRGDVKVDMTKNKKGATAAFVVAGFWILLIAAVVYGGYTAYENGWVKFDGAQMNTGSIAGAPDSGVCTQALSASQTPSIQTYDADTNAAITPTVTLYIDPAKGQLNPSTTVTSPGHGYVALATKASYTSALIPFKTACNEATPMIPGTQKALDTSVSGTFYNVGGRTANTAAANQTLTASSPVTISLELTPSAVKKHIANGPNTQFAIFMNDTTATNWDTSGFAANLYGGINGWSGSCQQYTGVMPSQVGGVVVYGWICNGDFDGKSMGPYGISLTIKPSASYSASNKNIGFAIIPVDYYKVQTTGALGPANSVAVGPVYDNSTAIATPQGFTFKAY
jgi:hypothetical protein